MHEYVEKPHVPILHSEKILKSVLVKNSQSWSIPNLLPQYTAKVGPRERNQLLTFNFARWVGPILKLSYFALEKMLPATVSWVVATCRFVLSQAQVGAYCVPRPIGNHVVFWPKLNSVWPSDSVFPVPRDAWNYGPLQSIRADQNSFHPLGWHVS